MSSTNVHSKDDETISEICIGGQVIPNEKREVIIPPKAAKKGPSIFSVRTGNIMVIEAHDGVLGKDGKLMEAGKVVADLGKEAYAKLKGNNIEQDIDR